MIIQYITQVNEKKAHALRSRKKTMSVKLGRGVIADSTIADLGASKLKESIPSDDD